MLLDDSSSVFFPTFSKPSDWFRNIYIVINKLLPKWCIYQIIWLAVLNKMKLFCFFVCSEMYCITYFMWLIGIHAREWITPATLTYMINELIDNPLKYDCILNDFDFYFIPLMNPDGYVYSHEYDRMWRKTRNQNLLKTIKTKDDSVIHFKFPIFTLWIMFVICQIIWS